MKFNRNGSINILNVTVQTFLAHKDKMPDKPFPLFSVITINRNNLSGLKSTQNSIGQQKTKDYEWLVIDGNSKDGSKQYLESLPPDEKYIFISEPDKGIYDAMNKGIKRATGKYLIFINSGDRLADKNTLQNIKNSINGKNYAFIYGDALETDKNGKKLYKKARHHSKMHWGMITHHQAMLYNRDEIITRNMKYDTNFKIAGDYDFTAGFIKNTSLEEVLYCPFPICIFESGGISQRSALKGRTEQFISKKHLRLIPLWKNVIIFTVQTISWIIKKTFPKIYWKLRWDK